MDLEAVAVRAKTEYQQVRMNEDEQPENRFDETRTMVTLRLCNMSHKSRLVLNGIVVL